MRDSYEFWSFITNIFLSPTSDTKCCARIYLFLYNNIFVYHADDDDDHDDVESWSCQFIIMILSLYYHRLTLQKSIFLRNVIFNGIMKSKDGNEHRHHGNSQMTERSAKHF